MLKEICLLIKINDRQVERRKERGDDKRDEENNAIRNSGDRGV